MVYSMTGFGQASIRFEEKLLKVDIRTLNGKSTDIRLKVPSVYKSKEIEIRNRVIEATMRGKIDMNIFIESPYGEEQFTLNTALIEYYHNELAALNAKLGDSSTNFLDVIMKIPNVLTVNNQDLSEDEWIALSAVIDEAIADLLAFRKQEGVPIHEDLTLQANTILEMLDAVVPFEEERVGNLRRRLATNIEQELHNEKVDRNRFEQELFYYIEKLDISEEKTRLAHHCNYFLEILNLEEDLKGRKLSFVSQEIGREINTLGAKAQHTEIQKLVVNMKDALEKIKEQIANII